MNQSAGTDQPAPLLAREVVVFVLPAELPVNMPSEAVMRIAPVLLVIWLIIGAIAGGQRHYYSSSDPNCSRAGTITVTILAGPLNYVGVNPKVACKAPQPSK
jgi:hypothetical protein